MHVMGHGEISWRRLEYAAPCLFVGNFASPDGIRNARFFAWADPTVKEKNMTDPVCGMEVDTNTAPTSTYDEKEYAFCSAECKEEFDSDPEIYTQVQEEATR